MRPAARPLVVLSLLLGACSLGRAPTAGERDLLTGDQLRSGNYTNAFEAVRALRSNWLRARGVDSFRSPTQVQVYLDDVRLGGVDQLRALEIPSITYIRYVDALAASARWGLGHGQGVIYVSSRPR